MGRAGLLLILAWNSREDIRSREIPMGRNLLFGAAGFLWSVMTGKTAVDIAVGMAVGILLLGISVLTGEAVGRGDALLLVMTGSFLGGRQNAMLLLTAWVASGIWSGILLSLRKAGRRSRIPFVPFLLLAYMGQLLVQ